MTERFILFSWIGGSDRKAAEDPNAVKNEDFGAIARVLLQDTVHYDQLILLSDKKKEDEGYLAWLKKLCEKNERLETLKIEMEFHQVEAMDRPALYQIMRDVIERHSQSGSRRTYLLSSGTPAMHLCWTLLGHTERYHARLIDSSRQEGAKEVAHWLELAHAFIPTIPKDIGAFLATLGAEQETPDIIGNHPGIQRAKGLAALAAQSKREDYPVLIYGETGTGKESIARLIHDRGQPTDKAKFVAINCGAITESLLESELFGHKKGAFTGAISDKKGLFEQAGSGGTVFLDEIGEMPPTMQTQLLRVLQEKKVRPVGSTDDKEPEIKNIRIVAATHRSLADGIGEGWFRGDLYYRLNVIEIHLPPLRERDSDMALLAHHFIEAINRDLKESGLKPVELDDDAMQPLLQHHWPGNIRELQNTLRRAAIFANRPDQEIASIDAELLREVILPPATEKTPNDWADRPLGKQNFEGLLDDVYYHYYQRILRERPGHGRQDLADSLAMTEPTLRKYENAWKKQNREVALRQKRKKRETGKDSL